MKSLLCTALLGVLLSAAVCASPVPTDEDNVPTSEANVSPGEDNVVAFVNVTVIPMDSERVLEGQTVVVRGERIVAVGPADVVEVPEEALRIDGTGKFLAPGLAEMHGHIPSPNAPPEFTDAVLFLYVANGITTVRGMLGFDNQLALREKANRGQIIAPTLYLAGPSFNGNSIGSPEEAVEKVRRQKAEGWDLLKIHPGLTLAEYDAMARTAHEEGIRFGGHVPADVGLMHAIEQGQETFDHLDGYVEYLRQVKLDRDDASSDAVVDEAALAEAVRRTKEAGAWVVPTMALWEVLYGTLDIEDLRAYDELKYMPPEMVQGWFNQYNQRLNNPQYDRTVALGVIKARMRVLEALHDADARILMGTDAPQQFSVPGFSLHRELERMEAVGMSPYAILKTGTKNVGEYFAHKDAFGTIAESQRADLLLLDANPLDSIANLQAQAGVMVRGRWLSQDVIQKRLAEIAAAYATP